MLGLGTSIAVASAQCVKLGPYCGSNTTGDFPTESDIINARRYTAAIVDSVSVFPNTEIYEYAWIAVPVADHAPFTLWEEVGSLYNRSVIGAEGSGEFIIIKDTTIEADGIEYYIYKYNWPTEFTNTLKLY